MNQKFKGAVVADPRFIAAVVILFGNDHWAKQQFGNWLTGKISDVAGLFVLGVLALALAKRRFKLSPFQTGSILAVIGTLFALIKSISTFTEAVAAGVNLVLPWHNVIVTDPTDVLAVTVLPFAWFVAANPRPLKTGRTFRILVIGIGGLSCVATSYSPPQEPEFVCA